MVLSNDLSGGLGRLPTPAKILLILSLSLLPIGLASAWSAKRGLDAANMAIEGRARDQALVAGKAVQNLLTRHRLSLRVAANAALADGPQDACADVQRILALSPDLSREFSLADDSGTEICRVGNMGPPPSPTRLAPGDYRNWISPDRDAIFMRAGVNGGSSTVRVPASDLEKMIADQDLTLTSMALVTGNQILPVVSTPPVNKRFFVTVPMDSGRVEARISLDPPEITTAERLFIFLPLLMWAAAGIVSWWMVHWMLIRPLRRLQGAIGDYQPGEDAELIIPPDLGPATEIHELGGAFQRAVARIEVAERDALQALDGQRRLVREVHHRVKNNLQVVASLLSIHGRSAEKPEAMAAYSAIGRRVDALSVVHRNHYAELEESRGIALRPLLTELAAGLRSSATHEARGMAIELDLGSPSTTQDVAVAVAFLVTEIVEFAMLRRPNDPIEIALRRNDELTATLSLSSSVLVPESRADDIAKIQFERIVEGLARQLRSPLQRKLGRYVVTLPVFPEDG
jgi:two-component sensor histidine kinase